MVVLKVFGKQVDDNDVSAFRAGRRHCDHLPAGRALVGIGKNHLALGVYGLLIPGSLSKIVLLYPVKRLGGDDFSSTMA